MNDELEIIEITEKHSKILRWTHWINFPLLTLMCWSGILIYWANDAYISISPKAAEFLSIRFRLAEGMGWHFFIMWLFLINGLVYISYMFVSGEWRTLAPDRNTFKEAIEVVLYEIKITKKEPISNGKFNSAQKLAYLCAILMGGASILTGIAIYKPVTMGWLTTILGGYEAARLEHFILMLGFILFFIIHVSQVIRAGWNNFRAMISGYSIEKK